MPISIKGEQVLDTIATLAAEIGRDCPHCADRAGQILALLKDVEAASPDRGMIQDAIEAETFEDLSDAHVRSATEAVIRATRGES